MRYLKIIKLSMTIIFALVLTVTGCDQAGQKLSQKKAEQSFKSLNPEAEVNIKDIRPTPMKGIYEVVAEDNNGRYAIVYMSGNAKYLISGNLIDVNNKENMTLEREHDLTKVDFASIPFSNSIILGNPEAANKVFVFSDPSCLPCAFYHEELKKAVREHEDITVYLKMFALPQLDPKSYEKARAIHCGKDNEEALKRLDILYAAETVPYPDCEGSAVDENMALASRLKILRSPTTIFPNGVKIAELMRADDFVRELEKRGGSPVAKKSSEESPEENPAAEPDGKSQLDKQEKGQTEER
ncbi:DsbC family protein [Nitrospirota bacterium]